MLGYYLTAGTRYLFQDLQNYFMYTRPSIQCSTLDAAKHTVYTWTKVLPYCDPSPMYTWAYVLGHWVLGPYALDTTSRATAQNLAKTCSTPSLFGIPACIIQSRLFTSSKHYSLKSRWNVYYPLVTCLLGAHALLCPCENIHQNQTPIEPSTTTFLFWTFSNC